jgi:hypothetical protein
MDPFNFCTALDQTILLGTKARTIDELLDGIRTVPKSSIYFHTHRFLRAHHYLTPEPSNDFGGWVAQALNNVVLGEKLSSIDVVQFHNIDDLKEQIANMISQEIGNGSAAETCPPGEEFHFMASRLFVMRTPFTAHSLREFRELLARLSLDSLYYHIFDSKLRLENGQNDFSRWFQSLGKTELADEVARLDPYTYTLEGLRKRLIILTAKHDLT